MPLLRVNQSKEKNVDFALMPSFIPTFTTACDQASKLGLGRNKTIISMYSNYQVGAYIYILSRICFTESQIIMIIFSPAQVVQMNKLPLILTFVGAEDCNTGHILALEHQVDSYLEDIKLAVTEP